MWLSLKANTPRKSDWLHWGWNPRGTGCHILSFMGKNTPNQTQVFEVRWENYYLSWFLHTFCWSIKRLFAFPFLKSRNSVIECGQQFWRRSHEPANVYFGGRSNPSQPFARGNCVVLLSRTDGWRIGSLGKVHENLENLSNNLIFKT